MKNRYIDLIDQTFDFPQQEFHISNSSLYFHNIDLVDLVHRYGSPLKFTYLPIIGDRINQCRNWFRKAIIENNYEGNYHYSYCTKSSHFNFILEECLKNGVSIETSSAFDIDILIHLFQSGKLYPDTFILCNGFKTREYVEKIAYLIALGFYNVIPIIDSIDELDLLDSHITSKIQIGVRIATEEDPKFGFYTSRLGVGYNEIIPLYNEKIKPNNKFKLCLLHFFVNTGIRDNTYYWNELRKFLDVYKKLETENTQIKHLDIGGGFPVKNSLNFKFNYEYLINEIVCQIKNAADSVQSYHPNIFTEFGSFTVAESSGVIFSILSQKKQNDREKWNMINGSFITTLPDTWAINKRFIMLPLNHWDCQYERVFLGGLTCDSDDYYNSEQHINAIYLPKFNSKMPLHIGFFNTGAYQESISGYGGLKHCLIPSPKHIIIDKDLKDEFYDFVYREQQKSFEMLEILGYK